MKTLKSLQQVFALATFAILTTFFASCTASYGCPNQIDNNACALEKQEVKATPDVSTAVFTAKSRTAITR